MAEGFGPLLSYIHLAFSYIHLAFSYIHLASDVNNSSCMVFAAEALKNRMVSSGRTYTYHRRNFYGNAIWTICYVYTQSDDAEKAGG